MEITEKYAIVLQAVEIADRWFNTYPIDGTIAGILSQALESVGEIPAYRKRQIERMR